MAVNIVVPEMGESIVDARIARWLKKEGEPVSVGEPLVELETDKIDVEVPALRQSLAWSIRTMNETSAALARDLAAMRAYVQAIPDQRARAEFERTLRDVELLLPFSEGQALSELHAVAGRPEQARRLLGEYERTVPAGQRRAVRRAGLSYGRVAEAEGKLAEAAEAYRDAYARTGFCGNCGLRELAAVLDRQGQADSARTLYERFVATPTAGGRHREIVDINSAAAQEAQVLAAFHRRADEGVRGAL